VTDSTLSVVLDAGHVAHHLPRADRPLFRGVRGHVPLDRDIEVDAPALVKQTDGSRCQRYRDAADAEARERRDRHAPLDVGPAEPLGPDDRGIHRNGHRETRQVLVHE